jgi:uncharacterized protein
MQLVHDSDPHGYTIVGHADGEVHINALRVTRSCIVAPDRLVTDWAPRALEELAGEHLTVLFDFLPEVVLLGVGARLRFPAPGLLGPLLERKIGVEVMDTPAACRTYNLLKGDGRRVVAALLIG